MLGRTIRVFAWMSLVLASQACATGAMVSSAAMRAVGAEDQAPSRLSQNSDGDHWSEEWVWSGD